MLAAINKITKIFHFIFDKNLLVKFLKIYKHMSQEFSEKKNESTLLFVAVEVFSFSPCFNFQNCLKNKKVMDNFPKMLNN